MQRVRTLCAVLFVAVLGWLRPGPAAAVLIDSGDGTANTTAPPSDPGFAHVGVVNGLTAIYLGNGWVLTANHVGTGSITLQGVTYQPVSGSSVRLEDSPGVPTDLRLFRIVSDPGLAPLEIATTTPSLGKAVIMIGNGRSRGSATTWQGISGWTWAYPNIVRWGTNAVTDNNFVVSLGDSTVQSFSLDFDSGLPTSDEAIATVGDSGGAAFVAHGTGYDLAGVLFAIYTYGGQPSSTSLYGNGTLAVDLAAYRDQIVSITSVPACSDGIDDDGDGLVDYPDDPGCTDANDPFETNALVACDDGFDNDGDGLVDYPDDPGCRDSSYLYENPKCDDGIDNDGDGFVDWDGGGVGAPDPDCTTPWRNSEKPPVKCGLGFELVAIVPLLARLRRLRRGR